MLQVDYITQHQTAGWLTSNNNDDDDNNNNRVRPECKSEALLLSQLANFCGFCAVISSSLVTCPSCIATVMPQCNCVSCQTAKVAGMISRCYVHIMITSQSITKAIPLPSNKLLDGGWIWQLDERESSDINGGYMRDEQMACWKVNFCASSVRSHHTTHFATLTRRQIAPSSSPGFDILQVHGADPTAVST